MDTTEVKDWQAVARKWQAEANRLRTTYGPPTQSFKSHALQPRDANQQTVAATEHSLPPHKRPKANDAAQPRTVLTPDPSVSAGMTRDAVAPDAIIDTHQADTRFFTDEDAEAKEEEHWKLAVAYAIGSSTATTEARVLEAKALLEQAKAAHEAQLAAARDHLAADTAQIVHPEAPIKAESTEAAVLLTSEVLQTAIQNVRPFVAKTKKSHATWDVSTDSETKPDIRHTIAPEHKLEAIGGMIFKDPWGDGDDNSIFTTEKFYKAFVKDWAAKVTVDVEPTFIRDGYDMHWTCDVDTETGNLVPPVEHPICMVDPQEDMRLDEKLRHHRQNWTSNLLIARENGVRERRMFRYHNSMKPHNYASKEAQNQSRAAVEDETPKVDLDCIFRPVERKDAEGILEIYNSEIKRGIQAFDTKLLHLDSLSKIVNSCLIGRLPFIVAVNKPVDLTDPAQWPSRAAYQQFMKWKRAEQLEQEDKDMVVAFGFCSEYDQGLVRSKGTGRMAVKAHFFVHPEYRLKGLGRATLDLLLTFTARLHAQRVRLDWSLNVADPNNVYSTSSLSKRPIHRVMVEGLFRGKDDPELKSMKRLMSFFNFYEQAHLDQLHRTQRGSQSEWLDKVIWLHDSSNPTDLRQESDPGVHEPELATGVTVAKPVALKG